jgi:hypothetical protein
MWGAAFSRYTKGKKSPSYSLPNLFPCQSQTDTSPRQIGNKGSPQAMIAPHWDKQHVEKEKDKCP